MKVLLLGYGNPGRGDDGLGPLLVERLEQHCQALADTELQLGFLTSMQLEPEHVLDLEGQDRVLLIDAGMGTPAPFSLEQVQPFRDDSFSTHALSPRTLLAIYRDTLGKEPPPTFLLTVRGEGFSLGAPFSSEVLGRLDLAFDFVASLLGQTDSTWLQQAGGETEGARTIPG